MAEREPPLFGEGAHGDPSDSCESQNEVDLAMHLYICLSQCDLRTIFAHRSTRYTTHYVIQTISGASGLLSWDHSPHGQQRDPEPLELCRVSCACTRGT